MNAMNRWVGCVAAAAVLVCFGQKVIAATNTDFINQAFHDLLARSPSGAESSSYLTYLATHTRQEAALQIETATPEFHGIVVDNLYSLLLHRTPSSADRLTYVGFITSGATIEQAEGTIGGSSEYFINRGGNTSGGFVTAMYSDLLNRIPSTPELSAFVQQLNLGSTPTDISGEILASTEYQTDLVGSYFLTYLRRSAAPSEATAFVNQMKSSIRDEVVISEIIGSNEYFNSIPFPEPAALSLFAAPVVFLLQRRRGRQKPRH